MISRFGKVKFTLINTEGRKTVPFFLHPNFDAKIEFRKRYWMEFWDYFFYCTPEACDKINDLIRSTIDARKLSPEEYDEIRTFKSLSVFWFPEFRMIGDAYPFLQDFSGTVLERHLENKELVKFLGYEKYKAGVLSNRSNFAIKHDMT